MKRALVSFLVLILLPFSASSAVGRLKMDAGTGLRWERAADDSIGARGVFGLGASFEVEPVELALEFTYFGEGNDDSLLEISRQHYEFLFWGRYPVISWSNSKIYVGAGAGVFWESVETQINSNQSEFSSSVTPLLGASASYVHSFGEKWGVRASLRGIANTNNSLAPVIDTLARLYFSF